MATGFNTGPDGDILLQRSPDGKTWELPCIPLELGERIDRTLVRGIRYTIGVKIDVERLVGVYSPGEAVCGPSALRPLSLLFLCRDQEDVTLGGRPSSREVAFFPGENLPVLAGRHDLLIRDARIGSDGTIF